MSTGWLPRLTSWQAARTDPSFALLGGDLAYCRGRPEGYARWQQWFADWEATMRAPDGRLIPLVAAIGNHDRSDGRGDDPARDRALLQRLPLPGSGRAQLLRAPLRAARGALRARLRSPGAARGRAARLARGGAARESGRAGALRALPRRALPGPPAVRRSGRGGASRLAAALRRLPPDGGLREPRPSAQAHASAARRRARRATGAAPSSSATAAGASRTRNPPKPDRGYLAACVRAPSLLEGDGLGAGRTLRGDRRLRARLRSSAAQDASGAWIRE